MIINDLKAKTNYNWNLIITFIVVFLLFFNYLYSKPIFFSLHHEKVVKVLDLPDTPSFHISKDILNNGSTKPSHINFYEDQYMDIGYKFDQLIK